MFPRKVVDESADREAPAMPQDAAEEPEVFTPSENSEAEAFAEIEASSKEAPEPEGESGFEEIVALQERLAEVAEDAEKEIAPEKIAKAEAPTPAVEEAQAVSTPTELPLSPEPPKGKDPEGIVTKFSPELYKKLMQQWTNRGKPREFAHAGATWEVYTEGTGGFRFVRVSSKAGMDSHYSSLTVGKV